MDAAGWLAKAESFLAERDVPEARASAEFLLAEVLGVGRGTAAARGERALTERQAFQFWDWVKRRGRREPIAYIVGTQPFLGLDLEVSRDCLIPRPETEELVLECERLIASVPAPKILEIGTGTGCAAIALSQLLPQATIFATDVSDKALALALKNAIAHNVHHRIRFVREDLFSDRQSLRGWADLVVSNPPYVPSRDVDRLEPEVRMEPRLALDGGPDGLDAIRAIVAGAPKMLKSGGALALEIEERQGAAVSRLLNAAGFSGVHVRKDASGRDRIAVGRLPEK
ncbi:MAG: peptide chain release factor N(5)-glutamine methyltransferase [Elusimicrobia bacterium]|nr:peptide chain release factor N(5)-glutamine methyltransferase [Elusimicrobiota bacterium]